MSGGDAPALEVRGLCRSFEGRVVVDGVDLVLEAGEVVGLLGPNGAGKTTCFRMIAGILRPDAGRVLLEGQDLAGLPLWRRISRGLGYLSQEPAVFRRLSVLQNLLVPIEARGASPEDAQILLEQAGLVKRADQAAGRLSGGERRRLELARALAASPRVLLLDEPFSGVDPVGVQDLQERIRRIAAQGVAVLITDHAVRETMGACNRVVLLDGGRVMAEGTPRQVAQDPRVRSRYLGSTFHIEEGVRRD